MLPENPHIVRCDRCGIMFDTKTAEKFKEKNHIDLLYNLHKVNNRFIAESFFTNKNRVGDRTSLPAMVVCYGCVTNEELGI